MRAIRLKTFRLIPALALSLVMLSTVGCDIFDTREPEPPGSGGTPWEPPTVPSIVFTNLTTGLEDLTGVNYEKSLGETFKFVPMPADVDRLGPEVFADWTKSVEVDVTQRILAAASSVEVSFINPEQTLDQDPFATFEAPYELIVTDTQGKKETYKGRARFDMQRLSQGWHLIQWEDLEGVQGFATWGYLRGTTR
ncbi:MAG: hypothetical protein JSW50_05925 [Candidatus Latescibacterota bacterium]|nr:MAG: hypothetical protein JSW50_05925 [Candidatus Latescibacterota bacterium]